MLRGLVVFLIAAFSGFHGQARDLKVVTWNMGWHISQDEATDWIKRSGAPFELNGATGIWEPAVSGTPGWDLKWGRDAKIVWDIVQRPPCDVYKTAAFAIVPVTGAAYAKRERQTGDFIRDKLDPDVIAFEEVSGEQAVKDILPNGGAGYRLCSFSGYKVQRLVIAWKETLGSQEKCTVEDALSLPSVDAKDRVRPGLQLDLRVDGQLVHFLAVHLKSSCVSPFEANGALEGSAPSCQLLQQQIEPLERWIERASQDTTKLVILGDFNRNLWHQSHDTGATRTDNSDPASSLPSGVKVRKLLSEVDDGAPAASKLTLLEESCPINPASADACRKAEKAKLPDEEKKLKRPENLGCSLPTGLDHILVGSGLMTNGSAEKVALGKQGRTLPSSDKYPEPLLALSDHCPLTAKITF